MKKTSARVALVSGADQGIGRGIACYLHLKGWTVFAGMRQKEAELFSGEDVRGVELDVADPASITAAVGEVLRLQGSLYLPNPNLSLAG